MLQIPREANGVNVASKVKFLTGQSLAHAIVPYLTAVQRAFVAADLHRGDKVLTEPTVTQSAMLTRVSTTYVHRAVARAEDRSLIENGVLRLVPAAKPALPAPMGDADLVILAANVGADRWLAAAAQAGL
jgi:hypothetical protein